MSTPRRFPAGPALAFAALLAHGPAAAQAPGCLDADFTDAIAPSAWVEIELAPAAGTAGVRDALRQAHAAYPSRPVRIRLAPGHYADTLGTEIYAQALWRSADAPLWLVAADARPDATVLGHGLNLLGVSYLAIDGLTIGPAQVGRWDGRRHADPQPLQAAAGVHVSGVAVDGRRNAVVGGRLDPAVYGRWQPSHHVLVRGVTVQNLFDPTERDGETSESLASDGMKFNQVTDLRVLDSRISQTTRHGIDNVGVHRAAFCRNLVSATGGGLGIEAKGGSVDILYEGNLFHRVRRVELGGEDTDATYYFSADGTWDYEALRVTARHNLIVDAREAALEFSGCRDCSAVFNTIWTTAAYRPPRDGDTIYGGDAIRVHDSRVLGAADGAGSDCPTWDEALQDHVVVDPCWQLGARAPAPVGRVLRSSGLVVAHNIVAATLPLYGEGAGGSVVPCPLNIVGGEARPAMDGNLWWNGGRPLPAEGCSAAGEGPRSRLATAAPLAGGAVDASRLDVLAASALAAAMPVAAMLAELPPVPADALPAYDHQRAPRAEPGGSRIGALVAREATQVDADRVFNWAERRYGPLLGASAASRFVAGAYARHYPLTQTWLGTAGGRLLVLSPLFGAGVVDLGALADWLPQAIAAGH